MFENYYLEQWKFPFSVNLILSQNNANLYSDAVSILHLTPLFDNNEVSDSSVPEYCW